MRDGFRTSTNIPLSRLIIRQLAVGTMKIICDSLGNDLGVIRLIQRDLSFDSRASRCAYQNDYSAGTILLKILTRSAVTSSETTGQVMKIPHCPISISNCA